MNRFYFLLTCTLSFILSHSKAQVSVCESGQFWSLCNETGKIISEKYDTIFTLKQFKGEGEEFETVGYFGYSGGEINYKVDSFEIFFENPEKPGDYMEGWNYKDGVWLKGGMIDIYDLSGESKWEKVTSLKIVEARLEAGLHRGSNIRDLFRAPDYPSFQLFPILADSKEPLYLQINGKWGLGKLDGTSLLPFQFDEITSDYLNNEVFFHVEKKGKMGLHNKSGLEIVPPEYDTIISLQRYSEDYEFEKPVLHLGYSGGEIKSVFEVNQFMMEDFENPGNYIEGYDTTFNYYLSGGIVDLYNNKGKNLAKEVSGLRVKSVYRAYYTGEIRTTEYRNLFKPSELFANTNFPKVFSEELPILVKTKGVWGSIKLSGETIIPFKYDSIEVLEDEGFRAFAYKMDKTGLYGDKGNLLPVEDDLLKVINAGDEKRYIFKVQGKDTLLLNSELKPVSVNLTDESDPDFINVYNIKQAFFAEWLINQGFTLHHDEEVLYAAVYDNNIELVELFLRKGAKINDGENTERIPLFAAVSTGNPAMIKLLLENGADIDTRDFFGQNALDYAIEINASQEIIEILKKGKKH